MMKNTFVLNFLFFWISLLFCFAQSNPIEENSSNITTAPDWPPFLTLKKGFYVSPHKANWYSSYMYCKSNNSRLARVESQEEHNEVVEIIKDAKKPSNEWYWLGGTDMPEEGTWSWLFLGQKVKGFENWGSAEPNNRGGREDCLNLVPKDDKYFWNDENCWEEFYFVCEFFVYSNSPECVSHDDCPIDRACQASRCVNPCEDRCGSNTVCRVQQHIPTCACKPGFTGNPLDSCSENDSPECVSHDDCPIDRACQASRCVNPCEDRCGSNTVCRVQQHVPTCACKPGFTGNPLDSCSENEIQMEWSPKYLGKKKFSIESFTKLTWHAAYFQCMRMNNSRLASIVSLQEHEELVALMERVGLSSEEFWLGGSDLAIEGRWLWSRGQDMRGFTFWQYGEPNNVENNEHCLAMVLKNENHKWFDLPCSREYYYVCEHY